MLILDSVHYYSYDMRWYTWLNCYPHDSQLRPALDLSQGLGITLGFCLG